METFERAKAYFFAGLKHLETGDLPGAEEAFGHSLEALPGRVSTMNNLAAVKIRLNKLAEAETFARQAAAAEGNSAEAWSNLAIVLNRTARHAEALATADRAVEGNFMFARAWHSKAEALLGLGRPGDALAACDEAVRLDAGNDELLHTRSLILKALGQADEARKTYLESLARRIAKSPALTSHRRASQRAHILIVSDDPPLDDSLKSFAELHQECNNYPGQLDQQLPDVFRFTKLFKGNAVDPAALQLIPRPDLVLNNCTNAEAILGKGELGELTELMDSFGVPVVNHPAQAVKTSRDATAQLVQGIPSVRVPKTMRFSSANKSFEQLAQEIEAEFSYPLITRTLSKQEGIGMERADSHAGLLRVFDGGLPENFFVTEFVDSRGGREFYRKIRAAIVGDEIIFVRADHGSYWKIYGRKSDERVAFYHAHPELLDDEKRICADPEKELGRTVVAALAEIRRRIPLEIFGVDFDVDGDGALVFFEANATMNLLSTARKEVPYPEAANERLLQAFRDYLTKQSRSG
ncbi:MAG: hypothetical protein RLY20_3424 [Verrucomicrobiota bacterium]|jgi:glutathione synthase/RimK-type ligase-like ATP-grasp enzyme